MEENSEITNKIYEIIQDMGGTANKKTYKSKEKELMEKIKKLNETIEKNNIKNKDKLIDEDTKNGFDDILNVYLNTMIDNREGRGTFFFPSGLKKASTDLKGNSIVKKFAVLEGKKLKSSSSLSEDKVKELAKLYSFIKGGKQIATWEEVTKQTKKLYADEDMDDLTQVGMQDFEKANKTIENNKIQKNLAIKKKPLPRWGDAGTVMLYLSGLRFRAKECLNKYGINQNYYLHICEQENLKTLSNQIDSWMKIKKCNNNTRNDVYKLLQNNRKTLENKLDYSSMIEPRKSDVKTKLDVVTNIYQKLIDLKKVTEEETEEAANGGESPSLWLYSNIKNVFTMMVTNLHYETKLWEDEGLKKAILACIKN